jgi:hypothetical protein
LASGFGLAHAAWVTPEVDRFLELATRPLEKRPTVRDEALTELMGRIGHLGVPLDRIDLSVPIAKLESAAVVNPWKRRGLILVSLLGMLILALVGAGRDLLDALSLDFIEGLRYRTTLAAQNPSYLSHRDPVEMWFEDQLLAHAFRDAVDIPLTGLPGDGETARLRERDPEDLGVLQEHLARRSFEAPGFMTAEEETLVTRLDPDNALWPLMEIRWIESKTRSTYYRSPTTMPKEDVIECHRLFSLAASKPHLTNHAVEMLARQKASLRKPVGVMDLIQAEAISRLVLDGSVSFYSYGGSGSPWLFGRADEFSRASNREALEALWAEVLAVQRLRLASPEAMVFDYNDNIGFMDQARRVVYPGIGKAGLPPDYPLSNHYPMGSLDGSVFLSSYGRITPKDVSATEMAPFVRAEMAMMHRFSLWFGCGLLLGVIVLTLVESVRRSRRARGLARGLMPLLTGRDHVWIAGGGILLPWLWYLVIRVSPLGSALTEDSGEGFVIFMLQSLMALVLCVLLLIHLTEWRWALRGGFLGLGKGLRIFGWLAAAITALAMPAAGLMPHLNLLGSNAEEMYLLGCAGAGSIGLLALLWVAITNLFTGGRAALGPNLVARTVLPWMLVALSTLLLLAGGLLKMESHALASDRLVRPETSRHFVHALEERGMRDQIDLVRDWLDGL